ncbi:MAG: sulfite exporter TauE/SafE family protein [Candidatus Aminicenantales bacterium]
MLGREIIIIAGTAATVGFVHTLLGPDHYLPFVVISRARRWSLPKTLFISFLCGLGHVLSSVLLGFIGIGAGVALFRLENIESFRGGIAAWLLIGFGLSYFVWGIHRALRKKPHRHLHFHEDGREHDHLHTHEQAHAHVHLNEKRASITPWILFTIFVFGPCEPLIPLVMYPAAKHNLPGLILVTLTFGLVTIATMLVIIALSSWGISFVRLGRLERYVHALAGAMIFFSGISVQFLGL